MKIGIVGLGLIGGSLAKSIKSKTSHTVYAFDINEETMLLARMCGAYDKRLDDENLGECDLVILAIRPGDAVDWAKENASKIAKGAILTDVCGIKRAIVPEFKRIAKENGFFYVGAHPMAGKERGRFQNSTDDLFVGASLILVPDPDIPSGILGTLCEFSSDIGFARNVFSNPEEHDRIIAYTSQLPHILSSAYVKSPEAQKNRGFSAGSFNDLSRVALLDENMWTELFMANSDFLADQLDILSENLKKYSKAVKERDADTLKELLREGRELKSSAGGH